jgi:hypothetical protein
VPVPDLICLFIAPLHAQRIETYMVSGSLAAIEYGEPRSTLDVDVAIMLPTARARELISAFPEPEYYCPPEDILASEINRPSRGHFNVIHVASGLKADFYPSRNHPLFDWALANRRQVALSDTRVWLAPPEYVILWKLEFFREGAGDKHLRDVRGMLAVSGDQIDQGFLEEWAGKLGLGECLQLCLDSWAG